MLHDWVLPIGCVTILERREASSHARSHRFSATKAPRFAHTQNSGPKRAIVSAVGWHGRLQGSLPGACFYVNMKQRKNVAENGDAREPGMTPWWASASRPLSSEKSMRWLR